MMASIELTWDLGTAEDRDRRRVPADVVGGVPVGAGVVDDLEVAYQLYCRKGANKMMRPDPVVLAGPYR